MILEWDYDGSFEWFICPDDEDKCHERAYAGAKSESLEQAKRDCEAGVEVLAKKMLSDCYE